MSESGWGPVYDEALRAIKEQQQVLDTLRNRASLLVAATVPAGTVLADRHPPQGWRRDVWFAAVPTAVALALVAVVLATLILRPHNDWSFRPSLRTLADHAKKGADAEQLTERITERLIGDWHDNKPRLDNLHTMFAAGMVLVVIEYLLTFIAQGVS